MKLWEQLFSYEEQETDYIRGEEIIYFYSVTLKVKIGNNLPGTQFDVACLSYDDSTIFFENEDKDEDEESARSWKSFKLKLTVTDE